MNAGRLREKVAFERLDTTADVYGNTSDGTFAEFYTTWGSLSETGGRERVESGALQAPMTAILTVRSDSLSRTVTEADRATIDSVNWNIRSIRNPDMKDKWLEMTVERAVAG